MLQQSSEGATCESFVYSGQTIRRMEEGDPFCGVVGMYRPPIFGRISVSPRWGFGSGWFDLLITCRPSGAFHVIRSHRQLAHVYMPLPCASMTRAGLSSPFEVMGVFICHVPVRICVPIWIGICMYGGATITRKPRRGDMWIGEKAHAAAELRRSDM